MALSVTLALGSSSYSLLVEELKHSFTRLATQVGLPTTEGAIGPNLTLDLGMQLQQITLTGIIDVNTSPTKNDLETAMKTWWKYGDSPTSLPTLAIPGGTYYVNLKLAEFTMLGAQEAFWHFSITLLVNHMSGDPTI